VRLALTDSPSVAQAKATLQRYQATERATIGARQPEVIATPSIQRQKFNPKAFGIDDKSSVPGFGGFNGRTFDLFSLTGRVNYDLDLFGGGRRRVEAAGARTQQAAHEADAAYLALSGNVALQAMHIAGLRGEIAAMEQINSDDRALLGLAHKAFAVGGIPRTTVTQVEAQLAEDEAILPPLRRQYDQARHQLALLVGKSPADWTAPDFDLAQMTVPSSVPVALPSSLVRRRPDILAAEAELHAATAAIGVAMADQYPAIRLSANGGFSGLTPGDVISPDASAWTLLGGVAAPLFDGGARKARTKEAQAEALEALARYRVTVLRAFVEVSDAMAAVQSDQSELEALTRAVARSQLGADDTLAAARLGARTAGDVIQSRRQLYNDQRRLAQAQAQRLSDLIDLYAASAADWRDQAQAQAPAGGAIGVGPGR
jgi:NodT family efflux transporter outer membrane factor (OMF) lipoprotein